MLTLALGIGANTAIFSTVDAILIRALPFADPDRVVTVWEDATAAGFPRNTPSPGIYNDWAHLNRSFSGMAATRGASANLTGSGVPEQVVGRAVTANFFSVLGVNPIAGRAFTADEDRIGRSGGGHRLRAVAATVRWRPIGSRADPPDERSPVRGHRRDATRVRVQKSRRRILDSDGVFT